MRNRIIPIILIVVVAVAGYFAWRYYQQTNAAASGTLGGSGTIETDQLAITPQVSGRIILAPADEGVPIQKGAVLYKLDPSLLKLQVQTAQAGVNAANANYTHVKDDEDSNWADRQTAKATLQQAQVALNMAKVQVGYATISSPIDGSVANIASRVGENASPGSTLVMISNPASLTVTIYVSETDIGKVRIGQKGVVTTDSTPKRYQGEVVFVGSQAEFTPASIETKDQRTKLVYQVKLRVNDSDASLKPGMPADVVIQ